MMFRARSLGTLAVALLSAVAHAATPAAPSATSVDGSAAPAAPAASGLQLEPKAIDMLKAASARLAAARTMTFTAVISYESPSVFGPRSSTRRVPTSRCSGPTSCA